jgi:tetratricopeptide (TPR) repeat protein
MGLFDFLKKKNKINTGNGIKEIYFDDGYQIKERYLIKNGNKDGLNEEYYENGQIKIKCFYVNGIKEGVYEEYYDNGQMKIKSFYEKPLPIPIAKNFGPDDKFTIDEWKEQTFQHLKNRENQQGLQYYYNEYGVLLQISNFVDNIMVSFEEYFKNGNVRMKNVGENYYYYSQNNKKCCEIVIDRRLCIPKGIWINYNYDEAIEYSLNFDKFYEASSNKKEFDPKNRSAWKWIETGYEINIQCEVLKTIYDKSGVTISSQIVTFIPNRNLYLFWSYSTSKYRFNEVYNDLGLGQGIKYNGASNKKYKNKQINLLPIHCIDDLSESRNFRISQVINIVTDKKKGITAKNNLNAIEYYDKGLEKNANRAYKEAIIDFTVAIEIDNEYIDAYKGRADARIWIRDYEGVVDDCTKIIELNNEDIEAYESRGLAKASLKDYIGAIEDFDKTIALDNESKVYSSRGTMKKNLLDYNGALLDYNIAVEKFPEDDSSYFGRGELKYEIKDYLGAIEDFNKCLEIKPNRIMSFHKRGDCKLKIEDYKGAIEDYIIVVQNRQDKYGVDRPPSENASKLLASVYHNRGIARSKIKEYDLAIEDLKKAIELDPVNEKTTQLLDSLK